MAKSVAFLAAGGACAYQVRFAVADLWFQKGGAEDIRHAFSYSHGNISYLQALAESAEVDKTAVLREEVIVQPRLGQAWIELALRAEFEGDKEAAKQLLSQAYQVDRTWNTTWALTNFFYRAHDPETFWHWARESLRLAHGEYMPLFTVSAEMERDPAVLMRNLAITEARPMRAYIDFLRNKERLADAVPVAHSLVRAGTVQEDLPLLQSVVDHLIDTGDGDGAAKLWNSLVEAKWIGDVPLSNGQAILNPELKFPLSDRGFDWRRKAVDGVTTDASDAGQGVLVTLSGSQVDGVEPLEVRVPVEAKTYRFSSRTKWAERRPPAGLFWQISGRGMNDLRVPVEQDHAEFSVPPKTSILRVALRYERPAGVARLEGSLSIDKVLLEDSSPAHTLTATAQSH